MIKGKGQVDTYIVNDPHDETGTTESFDSKFVSPIKDRQSSLRAFSESAGDLNGAMKFNSFNIGRTSAT
jgi:hypothetical protein